MSTRSRAKTGATNATASTSHSKAKAFNGSQERHSMDVDSEAGDGKEGVKVASKVSISNSKKKSMPQQISESLCTCSKGDDGSPMILCSECQIWYHFSCVHLQEEEASDINVYICPSCSIFSGRHSTMTWEGDIAVEEVPTAASALTTQRKTESRTGTKRASARNVASHESEEISSSEDEYVEESTIRQHNLNTQSRQTSVASEVSNKNRPLNRGKSPSPAPGARGHILKRKVGAVKTSSPPPKKKKLTDTSTRSYCLNQLEIMFKEIFLRYPHVKVQPKAEDMDVGQNNSSSRPMLINKKLEELSEEEKEALIEESRQFTKELEQCLFEVYAEPDKYGKPHGGNNYKFQFRTLQFNLSKADRVVIHQRITSGNISPKELASMSSNDLADEETKQSIKLAEKEALEHSILLKSAAPRAKITHKGLQDIEDVNGDIATAHEIEVQLDREQEEEERRERERMARLRTTQRQRTASISVPPESPTSHQGSLGGDAPWGAPPPVPMHAMSPTASDFGGKMLRPHLSMQTSFDMGMEPELDLSDFLNMDGDQEPTSAVSTDNKTQTSVTSGYGMSPVGSATTNPQASPIGISPFASQAERQRAPSFDLNSLWSASAPKDQTASEAPISALTDSRTNSPIPYPDEHRDASDKEDAMELESNEANDQDFDMFLDKEPEPQTESKPENADSPDDDELLIVTPLVAKDVDSLPEVWTGKLTMPLDSTVPQETTLVARQIAGRPIPSGHPLWHTLFPTDVLRIEGRVPVENSVKYLLQMRFNATKELYAAVFAPSVPGGQNDFDVFCNFLIAKSRHGLVFPWGQRPKEYHPGRELYMIPLRQTDPLPEFVELLDDLKLPKIRNRDYLIGIWILNKGKLSVLPTIPSGPAPPILSPIHSQSPMSSTPPLNAASFQTPPHMPLTTHNMPPGFPSSIPGLAGIAPDALAAEVASLTPAQLQEVLKTLSETANMQLPPMPPAPSLPPQSALRPPVGHIGTPPMPMPGMPQHGMMSPAHQPWMHQSQPPPPPPGNPYGNYPPPNIPFQQPQGPPGAVPPMGGPPAIPPYPRPEYDAHQNFAPPDFDRGGARGYEHDFRGGPNGPPQYSQGGGDYNARGGGGHERGWRGNAGHHRGGNQRGGRGDFRGGRGGRGGGGGGNMDGQGRPSGDAGWNRRPQRNDSQGGNW